MKASKLIENHINDACEIAINEVERLARKILKNHPNLKDFVMGMGCISFELNGINLGLEERAYFKPLYDLINEWDSTLYITGYPMWIKYHDAPIINNW